MFTNIFAKFKIQNIHIAFNIQYVQEIVDFPESLQPVPLSPSFFIGLFDLRGNTIPLIDLVDLLKLGQGMSASHPKEQQNKKLVIINKDNFLYAILIDEANEILRLNQNEISYLEEKERNNSVIQGVIHQEDSTYKIQIIDPNEILQIDKLPQFMRKPQHIHAKAKLAISSDMKKSIKFQLEHFLLALDLEHASEIIDHYNLQPHPNATDYCSHYVELRGYTIPIINFKKLLGLEEQNQCPEKKVIVIKSEKRYYGIVIDAICNIIQHSKESSSALPFLDCQRTFIEGIIKDQNDFILSLNMEKLSASSIVQEAITATALYFKPPTLDKKKILTSKESYITFKIGQLFGLKISSIKEIIDMNHDFLRPIATDTKSDGLINLRGCLIPVYDLKKVFNIGETDKKGDSKILILEAHSAQMGLVVESVEEILNIFQENKMKIPELLTKQIEKNYHGIIEEIISIKTTEGEKSLAILNDIFIYEKIKNSNAA